MKLFVLLWLLIQGFFNVIYYIIISPWLLIKYLINRKVAKNVQVGDEGYFNNILGGRTEYTVADIREDKIRITTPSSSQWIDKKQYKTI